jgi:hypothetical protein
LIFGTAFLQRKVAHLFAPSLNRTRQDPGKASAIAILDSKPKWDQS